jgi:methionine synthase reductase
MCFCLRFRCSRLSELSATRFHKLGCADEAVGLENSVEPWIASMWPSLTAVMGGTATDANQGSASATPADATAEKAEGEF